MTARRANRRQLQAEATRRDILAAGRRLFAVHGYAATSMVAIAEEAGAAVQTIYASVGPKRAILMALLDLIDEEAGVSTTWQRIGQTDDPRDVLCLGVNLARRFSDNCGDIVMALLSAAPVEPDAAVALSEAHRRHREGTRRIAFVLAEAAGTLKPGLSPDRAGDIIGMLTWVETFRQLTQDYGWSFDECEEWIIAALTTLLLQEPA